MTRDEALALADKIIELNNSKPRLPTRDEIAFVIEAMTFKPRPQDWVEPLRPDPETGLYITTLLKDHQVNRNCPCGKWHGDGPQAEPCPERCVFEARPRDASLMHSDYMTFCIVHQRPASECQPICTVEVGTYQGFTFTESSVGLDEPSHGHDSHCDLNLTPPKSMTATEIKERLSRTTPLSFEDLGPMKPEPDDQLDLVRASIVDCNANPPHEKVMEAWQRFSDHVNWEAFQRFKPERETVDGAKYETMSKGEVLKEALAPLGRFGPLWDAAVPISMRSVGVTGSIALDGDWPKITAMTRTVLNEGLMCAHMSGLSDADDTRVGDRLRIEATNGWAVYEVADTKDFRRQYLMRLIDGAVADR